MKLSPWFSLKHDGPPVNGDAKSVYEYRCPVIDSQVWTTRGGLRTQFRVGSACPHCQWRGVLKEEGK